MEYLGRDSAPFDATLWEKIDKAVVSSASMIMTGRRFIPLYGPVGSGVQFAKIDSADKNEEFRDGVVITSHRRVAEIPQLYSDFWIYWRDVEAAAADGAEPDLSSAVNAAQQLALAEDRMIFHGNPDLGLEGLLSAQGVQSLGRSDWATGENAFTDIARGITMLEEKGHLSGLALVVSPNLFLQLQRIQPGTGLLEADRVKALTGRTVIKSTVLQDDTALLVSAEPHNMDLMIGQDVRTAYLETVDMNHHLRVMETALLRIKYPDAIVVFR